MLRAAAVPLPTLCLVHPVYCSTSGMSDQIAATAKDKTRHVSQLATGCSMPGCQRPVCSCWVWRQYRCGVTISVESLSAWSHYQCGVTISVESLSVWRHYQRGVAISALSVHVGCGVTISVESLSVWSHYQRGVTISVESLSAWRHCQCGVTISALSVHVGCGVTISVLCFSLLFSLSLALRFRYKMAPNKWQEAIALQCTNSNADKMARSYSLSMYQF